MVTQNTVRTCVGKYEFSETNFRFATTRYKYRSNNLFNSTRAYLFLSYNLIRVPWPVRNVNIITFHRPVIQHPLGTEKFDLLRVLDSQTLYSFYSSEGLGQGRIQTEVRGWQNRVRALCPHPLNTLLVPD